MHTDDDTSFKGEFGEALAADKILQTNTGGHRPTNNSHAEKRIGLLISCFRSIFEVSGKPQLYLGPECLGKPVASRLRRP